MLWCRVRVGNDNMTTRANNESRGRNAKTWDKFDSGYRTQIVAMVAMATCGTNENDATISGNKFIWEGGGHVRREKCACLK